MKIAFLGSRGIPARYSGFETFYEALATRLAARGHAVTVYNRSHFIRDVQGTYQGVRLVSLPCVQTKHLETITHTALSSLHALGARYDIVYYCIVGNSPLVWLPRLTGASVLINVDGQDWARAKWSGFARWYQRWCERVAGRTAHVVIADAKVIQQRYRSDYGVQTIFAPYGANVIREQGTEALQRWGLAPRRYVFYVGRLVPENAIDLLLRAFRDVRTDQKLVIVGDAPYASEYKRLLHDLADSRVIFTGYVFGQDYTQLSRHATLAVQPSGIDGTRPASLDQLGFGNAVVARRSPANAEVVADCGAYFDPGDAQASLTAVLQQLLDDPHALATYRERATRRIETFYNWEWITTYYESLFSRIRGRQPLISYDDFLLQATPPLTPQAGRETTTERQVE